MITLHIEHQVHDFSRWKAAFDSDPADRARSGVRRYVISRPVGQPLYVMIDLEFDDQARAEKMLAVLENVWQTPRARGAVSGDIKTAFVEQVEAHDL